MAKCKITRATAKGKAWKAECSVEGKKRIIQGGQDTQRGKWGTQGGKTTTQVKSFLARHGEPKTAKQKINEINWKKGSQIGKTINVPNKFFKKK
jgi:hypothetical protein